MKKNRFTGKAKAFFFILGTVSLTALSCSEKDSDLVKPKTITDVLRENPEFSIFREIVLATGMSDALRTSDMTLFIPDNAAFGRANISSASQITSKADSAKIFVNYHIVKGISKRSELTAGTRKTISDNTVRITRIDSTVIVNGSEIVIPDINIDNGIMHVIDSVLVRVR